MLCREPGREARNDARPRATLQRAVEGWKSVEVKEDAYSQYNASIHAKLGDSVWQTGCKSWYVNENGKNTTLWPGFTWQFRKQTRRFDAEQYVCESAEVMEQGAEPALAS